LVVNMILRLNPINAFKPVLRHRVRVSYGWGAWLRVWHRRWGLWSFGVLAIIALTGFLLGVEFAVTRAVLGERELALSTESRALAEFAAKTDSTLSNADVADWRLWSLKDEPNRPAWLEISLRDGQSFFWRGSGSGSELGGTSRLVFFDWVERIHIELAAGTIGKWVVLLATLHLLFLLLSGIFLRVRHLLPWRATKSAGKRLRLLSWHALAGWASLIPLGLLIGTGFMMGIPALSDYLRGSSHNRHLAPTIEPHAGPLLSWTAILGRADELLPPWQEIRLHAPSSKTAAWRVEAVRFGASHRQGRERVWLHPGTGEVLQTAWHAEQPFKYRARAVALALHDGSFFGLAGRLTALIASALLFFLCYSGIMALRHRQLSSHAVQEETIDGRESKFPTEPENYNSLA
jgi:uncharacterized iron-regulated membrane protein